MTVQEQIERIKELRYSAKFHHNMAKYHLRMAEQITSEIERSLNVAEM